MQNEPGHHLTEKIIGIGIRIHRALGPGLLEGIYADCLGHELAKAGLHVRREVRLSLCWDGMRFEKGYVADANIDNDVLLELKSVEHLLPVHEAQTRTYLRLSDCRLALLMNFGAPTLKEGIRRYIAARPPST